MSALIVFCGVDEMTAAPLIFPVIPASQEDVEGNTDVSPLSGLSAFSIRYQQVYDATAFTTAIPPEGAWIRDVVFRVDGPRGFSFERLLTNVQVNLSVTSRSADELSPIFDENIGANEMTMTGPGSLRIDGARTDPQFWPNPFVPAVVIDSPYYYNPSQGNLLLDIRVIGGDLGGPMGPGYVSPLDATDVVGDPVSSVYGYGSNMALPSTGTPSSVGAITLFTIEPIPEPSSLTLFGIGFAAVGWFYARRKKGGH